jgi:hypothetical protein
MKSVIELRAELSEVFAQLKVGAITPAVATEMNNSAGKIINTVKLELEYAALRKEKPSIPFLTAGKPKA